MPGKIKVGIPRATSTCMVLTEAGQLAMCWLNSLQPLGWKQCLMGGSVPWHILFLSMWPLYIRFCTQNPKPSLLLSLPSLPFLLVYLPEYFLRVPNARRKILITFFPQMHWAQLLHIEKRGAWKWITRKETNRHCDVSQNNMPPYPLETYTPAK